MMAAFCAVDSGLVGADKNVAGIEVNLNRTAGVIKPLYGVNHSPVQYGGEIKFFREAGIPFSRLHDTAGACGGTHFVDIPTPHIDRIARNGVRFTDGYVATIVFLLFLFCYGCHGFHFIV
jgi:hypothetical protein